MSDLFSEYEKMSKPREIEEVWDIYFIRPTGFLLVQILKKTNISPNTVSALSVAAAWLTAFLLYKTCIAGNSVKLSILAGLAFFLHSALDSADGQLARVTGKTSAMGRAIDGFCDNLSFLGIYIAIFIGYSEYTGSYSIATLFLGIAAGASHSFQSALTEYYRTFFIKYVYNKGNIEKLLDAPLEASDKRLSLFQHLLVRLTARYTKNQHALCRSSENLKGYIHSLYRKKQIDGSELSSLYRKHQSGMLKGWALLGPNAHKIGVAAASFLPVGAHTFIGSDLGLVWYWIYELLLLNIAMAVLIFLQRRVDRNIWSALEAYNRVNPHGGISPPPLC